MKKVTNRWGRTITVGDTVKANHPRGGHFTGAVTKIDRSSPFAKAYGVQLSLDTGYSCCADDVIAIEVPAK